MLVERTIRADAVAEGNVEVEEQAGRLDQLGTGGQVYDFRYHFRSKRNMDCNMFGMRVHQNVVLIIAGFMLAWTAILQAAPTHLVEESVVKHRKLDDGTLLIDFGKVAFGNLKWSPPLNADGLSGKLVWHFGEALKDGRVDRKPPGTVRYAVAETNAEAQVVAPAADKRNTTHPSAVKTPAQWGVVLPFRWVEIEGWKGDFKPEWVVRQSGYLKVWDDGASAFECSDPMLNRIWDLCKYSIKATTFAGVYVDGDRERIPYEADAYLNQLSHYFTDPDKQIARDTYDYLMGKPTWPTEWAPHMVFMAHADWLHTGDADWLRPRYEALKTKLLLERVGAEGWVKSNAKQVKRDDIVDWPAGERDGYQFREVNTVVNAFHLAALSKMADLAEALAKEADAKDYRKRFKEGVQRFNAGLWMPEAGAYRDGIGTDHASLHANLFPLAFGLVPQDRQKAAADFLTKKGMACSVYAAQYLMEGLFQSGADKQAIDLMLAPGDRSWRHMVESGTTISWEAWDQKYKSNQDWNHAWGAAPANLLPRFVLGVEPLQPGWKTFGIAPCVGHLTRAKGKVPTRLGPVQVEWAKTDLSFELSCVIPEGSRAVVRLPYPALRVSLNGKPSPCQIEGGRAVVKLDSPGSHRIVLTFKN